MAQQIQELHAQVHRRIIEQDEKYKARANNRCRKVTFRMGDLVWIHLGKDRVPAVLKGKLQPRADGPFRVLRRLNENAYKIELPGHYNISATFNVCDLSPFEGDFELMLLMQTRGRVFSNQGRMMQRDVRFFLGIIFPQQPEVVSDRAEIWSCMRNGPGSNTPQLHSGLIVLHVDSEYVRVVRQ